MLLNPVHYNYLCHLYFKGHFFNPGYKVTGRNDDSASAKMTTKPKRTPSTSTFRLCEKVKKKFDSTPRPLKSIATSFIFASVLFQPGKSMNEKTVIRSNTFFLPPAVEHQCVTTHHFLPFLTVFVYSH